MSVSQIGVNVLSNAADREKLLKMIRECSASMTRMEGEKDYIRESVKDVCKQLQLPKRLVQRMIKVYHKQNYDEEVATHEQFEQLYETIVK